jgi:hypothetical protein
MESTGNSPRDTQFNTSQSSTAAKLQVQSEATSATHVAPLNQDSPTPLNPNLGNRDRAPANRITRQPHNNTPQPDPKRSAFHREVAALAREEFFGPIPPVMQRKPHLPAPRLSEDAQTLAWPSQSPDARRARSLSESATRFPIGPRQEEKPIVGAHSQSESQSPGSAPGNNPFALPTTRGSRMVSRRDRFRQSEVSRTNLTSPKSLNDDVINAPSNTSPAQPAHASSGTPIKVRKLVRTASTATRHVLRESARSITAIRREDAASQREIQLSLLVSEALNPTTGPSLFVALQTLAAKEQAVISLEELVTSKDLFASQDPAAEKKIREFKHAFKELQVTKDEFLKAIDARMKQSPGNYPALLLLATISETYHETLFYSPRN